MLPRLADRKTMALEQTGQLGVLWAAVPVACLLARGDALGLAEGLFPLNHDTAAAARHSNGRMYCAMEATVLKTIGTMEVTI